MAVRASDDAIFVWNNASGSTITGVLLRVDRCTGLGVPVDPTVTPRGQLDAIAFQGSRLWGVGPATGSTSHALYEVITSTGIKILQGGNLPAIAGLAADPFQTLHGIEQVSSGNNPLGLFVIDTQDAKATRIYDIDDRILSGASLAFDGDVLLGTGQHRNGDPLIFEIDPLSGDISNILILEQVAQGIGVSASCEPPGRGAIFLMRSVNRESELASLKVQLVSRVSHDLKTPLAVIKMYGDTLLLGRTRGHEQVAQFAGIISREADRLTNMIERILDFSRKEAGTLTYETEPTNLSELISELAEGYRPHLESRGARLLTELHEH